MIDGDVPDNPGRGRREGLFHDFTVEQKLFDGLSTDSGAMRLYFAAHSETLLSLELLEPARTR